MVTARIPVSLGGEGKVLLALTITLTHTGFLTLAIAQFVLRRLGDGGV